ncbi:MAG: DUF929 family protein [Acidimicrobiales bacterium]
MPEPQDEVPSRSAADKERSRQQSRAVSGKEAARGVQGKPGQGKPGQGKPGQGKPGQGQPGQGKGFSSGGSAQAQKGPAQRGPAQKGPAQRGPAKAPGGRPPGQRPARAGARPMSSGPRRSPTALLTWGLVGLVLIIVLVLVVVKITGSNTSAGPAPKPQPLTAKIAREVTSVPASVYNTVGVTSSASQVNVPKVLSGQPALTLGGKPGVFYMGGEFCPYCAAERWALITSLSRFGKFSGLETMESASGDIYPNTQTFTLSKASYTSPYVTFQFREYYSNQKNSAGSYTVLQPLDKAQAALVKKYDGGGSATTSSGGSIPFVDFGNKVVVAGASYSPSILQTLSRSQIAGALNDAGDPVTQAIIGASNYLSASVCATDGQQPGSVCKSKAVVVAAKAMKLTS